MQKSKVRWAIEGDENSKYFHGIINKKRSQLAICEVFHEGNWLTDLSLVKKAFLDHYESRFKKPTTAGLKLKFSFPNRLSYEQAADLERGISRDEIRSAVWDFGENKSSGPDGFTFEFFRKYWECIGPDFCATVEHFFENGTFSKGCNSSFIALIPKVTDAKFVNDYRPIGLIGSVYKVVMKIMANRLALVITNIVFDSQSAFVAKRQILDGPFILNEVLHWCKRKNKKVWCNWIREQSMKGCLKVFIFKDLSPYPTYFMRMRLVYCQVLGMGVPRAIVEAMAVSIGCSIMQQKFCYLGVFVGECMSRHKAWDDVVLKLRSCLSKWKAKTLSISSRLTLLKSVLGASPLYTMSIFKVSVAEKLVAPLDISLRRLVRGGVEQQQFTDLSLIIDFVSLTPSFDRWVCSVSSDGDFSVKEVRNVIDDLSLPTHFESTR
nr:RNA-directed DNA polymerase, eukaryota [Tanacetum cinerariifolium]